MARLDFFAIRTDQIALLEFLFAETDIRVLEHSSRRDRDLREFSTAGQIDEAFSLGSDAHGNGFGAALALWSPSVMPQMQIRRIDFDRRYVPDARFRYEPTGAGLMQLYLGGIKDRVVTKSHFGHFNQAGARKWGLDARIDWFAFKTLSNRIQYRVRKLSVAKAKSLPVLPGAFELAKSGYALKQAYQTPWQYKLRELPVLRE